jgi:hypothetical protein
MSNALKWSSGAVAAGFVLVMACRSYGAPIPLPADAKAVYIDNGPHNDRSDLMVLYQSGTKIRLTADLVPRYDPVFSPDGSKIAFGVGLQPVNGHITADAKIVVVDLRGKVLNEFLVNGNNPMGHTGAADSIRWAGNDKLILVMGFNPDESFAAIVDLLTKSSVTWVDSAASISPAIDGARWALVDGVQHISGPDAAESVLMDGCDVGSLIDSRPFMVVSPLAWSLNTKGTRQLSLVIRQGPRTSLRYTLVSLGVPPDVTCDRRKNTDPATQNGDGFRSELLGAISVDKSRLPAPANRALDVSWNVFYSPRLDSGSGGDLVVLQGFGEAKLVAAHSAFTARNGRTTSLTSVSLSKIVDPADGADRLQNAFTDVLASNGLSNADADVWSASIALAPRVHPYARQSTTVPDEHFP